MPKLPINKLALLFLLNELGVRCTAEQMNMIEGDYDFLHYFNLRLSIDDMLESGLIDWRYAPDGNKAYGITEKGKVSLTHFQRDIPFSMRRRMSADAAQLKRIVRTESEYVSEYRKVAEGQYIVELRALEAGVALMEVRLNLPTLQQAVAISDAWSQNAGRIYQLLLQPLNNEDL